MYLGKEGGVPMKRFEEAASLLPSWLAQRFMALPADIKEQATEIRMRSDRPVSVTLRRRNAFLTRAGLSYNPDDATFLSPRELWEVFDCLCEGSVYSCMEQLREGYLTLRGGHRAGLAGRAVLEDGHIRNIKSVSSVNIRIARQIKGSGEQACRTLMSEGALRGALIVSPPSGGKTTMLRDMARILSCGGRRVCVVDSRGEIAACYDGVPQNDLGPLCDVLDAYPKAAGILQAVRTLSPEAVICDEVGGSEECAAIVEGMNAGVPVIASAHASSLEEALRRPQLRMLIDSGAVTWLFCLAGAAEPGKIVEIRDCRRPLA